MKYIIVQMGAMKECNKNMEENSKKMTEEMMKKDNQDLGNNMEEINKSS